MDNILMGLGVGLLVAAPLGPVGLLCIRRTLIGGRAVGLFTGFGAASAHAFYCLLVVAGLATSGIFAEYEALASTIGGGLLVLLGMLSFKAFLSKRRDDQSFSTSSTTRLSTAFASTFALAISNPMTILAFLGLVAGIGAFAGESFFATHLIVLGVFLGSLLWWVLLVHAFFAARHLISTNALSFLDLISGVLLLIWGGRFSVRLKFLQ